VKALLRDAPVPSHPSELVHPASQEPFGRPIDPGTECSEPSARIDSDKSVVP
jgi:hypothetical protein